MGHTRSSTRPDWPGPVRRARVDSAASVAPPRRHTPGSRRPSARTGAMMWQLVLKLISRAPWWLDAAPADTAAPTGRGRSSPPAEPQEAHEEQPQPPEAGQYQ